VTDYRKVEQPDLDPLGYATGGYFAAPDRPFIVGEQPTCCFGHIYLAPIPLTPPPRPEHAPPPSRG